jgi:hypothetical protein
MHIVLSYADFDILSAYYNLQSKLCKILYINPYIILDTCFNKYYVEWKTFHQKKGVVINKMNNSLYVFYWYLFSRWHHICDLLSMSTSLTF